MSKKSIKYGHMAQKRTSSAKRTASKTTKRKTTKRRRSSRKASKKIPAYKMIVYCALGVSICILAYLIADISLKTPQIIEAPSVTERFEEPAKKIEPPKVKVEPPKASEKTASKTVEKKPAEVKPAEVKPAEKKPVETVKKTEQKPVEVKPQTEQKPVEKPVKKDVYNFPAAQNGAKLVFIFDDGGQNLSHLEKFVTLPFPVTVAVLPQLAHSVASGARVRSSGNELMLHQPMQSVNGKVNPGPGAITPDMTDDQIRSTLFFNVNQIGPIAGINNHEGSAITADAEKMAVIMNFASEEGIYFLDSRTNVETKVPYVAEQLGYSYYERNIFLDNEKTKDNVLKELNKGLKIANQTGQVMMIAHVWSADFLPELLKDIYPELVSKGYKFCTVSQCEKKY